MAKLKLFNRWRTHWVKLTHVKIVSQKLLEKFNYNKYISTLAQVQKKPLKINKKPAFIFVAFIFSWVSNPVFSELQVNQNNFAQDKILDYVGGKFERA